MKIPGVVALSLALTACAVTRPLDAANSVECRASDQAHVARAAAAWAEAEPAQQVARDNPESPHARAAADAAMQKAASVAAQAAADLGRGPCLGGS